MEIAAPPGHLGQRLVPSLVDQIAATDPNRVLYSIPKTKYPADGFRDVDAKTFSRAVDRCAWFIEENLGRGVDFPTLTYIGPQDLFHGVLILACIKTGYKLFLTSPRNPLEAHLYLLEKVDCNVFVVPDNFPLPVIKQIQENRQMRALYISGLQHWIDDNDDLDLPYPYTKTFSEARSEPFAVLHTSGSTGMPKPIILRHGTVSAMDAFRALPSQGLPQTYPQMCAGKRLYISFPLFHSAGVFLFLPGPIYNKYTIVLGPFPPSADTVNGVIVHGNVQHCCVAPMTLVELVKDPDHLENLRRLEQITYGGGPCPKAVGDLISSRTRLMNGIGSTECGVLPLCRNNPDAWEYMSVSPALGHEYRHVSDDLYELVIVRNPKLQFYQGVFETFPDLQEWPMRDLYAKHPTCEGLWLYKGRLDDIIVFSTGEKLNPIDMESVLNSNPAISAALVVGYGRFQSSLLVEAVKPPTTEAEKTALLEAIWPSVEAANNEGPSHARIHKHMIVFASPDKPMLRASKGTVQRKTTVDLYAVELDSLYQTTEKPSGTNSALTNGTVSRNIPEAVKQIIAEATNIDVGLTNAQADLFELGLDSLQVTAISQQINSLLAARGHQAASFEPRMVYANPSIAALTAAVSEITEQRAPQEAESMEQKMEKLYSEHAAKLPISARFPASGSPGDAAVVLLTGSTGSLGSYILDALVADPRVSHVYCLNRGPRSFERQTASQTEKNLAPLPGAKVSCLDADLLKPYFGLRVEVFRKLLWAVTNVIHNAWQVDFNLSIGSFGGQVGAVRDLIDFSAHSRFGAKIFFVSSIGAVNGLHGDIPEQIISDWSAPRGSGYSQSKFVSERLLDAAAREASVPAVVCRVGQIAGPTTPAGIWPKREWFPSLLASSKLLSCIPDALGSADAVDWVPVDLLGRSIVELAFANSRSKEPGVCGAEVYHAINPEKKAWADLLPTVLRLLDRNQKIEIVPLETWVDKLRNSASATANLAENPAVKILDFFEDLAGNRQIRPAFETQGTKSVSQTLASVGPIREPWVENWIKQWAF